MSSAESIRSFDGHVQNFHGLMSLFCWENPIRSATAFVECLVLLAICQNNGLLRLILHLGYLAIGVTALTEFATKFLNGGRAGLISSYRPSRLISVNKEHLQHHADTIVAIGVEALYWLRRILDARDLKLTLVSFAGIWILYGITAAISFGTLATIVVILAFTLPAIYYRFKAELDHAHGHFSNIFNAKYTDMQGQFNTAAGPQLERIRAARDGVNTIFGYPAAGAAAAVPVAAAVPMMAPPVEMPASAPSIRSFRPPSVRAPSVHAPSVRAPSIQRAQTAPSIRSNKSGFNPAMAVGAGALGGAALGAGAMGMAGGHSNGGSMYEHSEYGDSYGGSAYGSESYISDGQSFAGSYAEHEHH